MTLSVTDPAILFPGISLLFLAFTNRYLALASIIRQLNTYLDEANETDCNRELQIQNLHLRITLIKYMQAFGICAFLCCVISMLLLLLKYQTGGEILFVASLGFMFISLMISLWEILKSGQTLRIELERTHSKSR